MHKVRKCIEINIALAFYHLAPSTKAFWLPALELESIRCFNPRPPTPLPSCSRTSFLYRLTLAFRPVGMPWLVVSEARKNDHESLSAFVPPLPPLWFSGMIPSRKACFIFSDRCFPWPKRTVSMVHLRCKLESLVAESPCLLFTLICWPVDSFVDDDWLDEANQVGRFIRRSAAARTFSFRRQWNTKRKMPWIYSFELSKL